MSRPKQVRRRSASSTPAETRKAGSSQEHLARYELPAVWWSPPEGSFLRDIADAADKIEMDDPHALDKLLYLNAENIAADEMPPRPWTAEQEQLAAQRTRQIKRLYLAQMQRPTTMRRNASAEASFAALIGLSAYWVMRDPEESRSDNIHNAAASLGVQPADLDWVIQDMSWRFRHLTRPKRELLVAAILAVCRMLTSGELSATFYPRSPTWQDAEKLAAAIRADS